MPPFSGDRVSSLQDVAVCNNPAADPRTEDYAENDMCSLSGAINRLRQGKTVCIVGHANGPPEDPLQVCEKRAAYEAR